MCSFKVIRMYLSHFSLFLSHPFGINSDCHKKWKTVNLMSFALSSFRSSTFDNIIHSLPCKFENACLKLISFKLKIDMIIINYSPYKRDCDKLLASTTHYKIYHFIITDDLFQF